MTVGPFFGSFLGKQKTNKRNNNTNNKHHIQIAPQTQKQTPPPSNHPNPTTSTTNQSFRGRNDRKNLQQNKQLPKPKIPHYHHAQPVIQREERPQESVTKQTTIQTQNIPLPPRTTSHSERGTTARIYNNNTNNKHHKSTLTHIFPINTTLTQKMD